MSRICHKTNALSCEEIPEQHFQVDKSFSVKDPGAQFTFKISVNQDLEPILNRNDISMGCIKKHVVVIIL